MTPNAVADGLIDLFFPKRCVQCRAPGAWLCEPCAGSLRPLPAESCPRCGSPGHWAPLGRATRRPRALRRHGDGMGVAGGRASDRADAGRAGAVCCPECDGRDLAFTAASAAFTYEGPARALVSACKFRALRSLADEMARLAGPAFGAACGATPAGPDAAASPAASAQTLVTWVPSHRERSLERGFNQAELLARGLARGARLGSAPVLRRTRHGARQSGLDRAARAVNVRDTFALREDTNGVLRKLKRVIVVDDVYTTGETLNRCAEVLAREGLELHVFTFARTVRAASSQASLDHAIQKERCR